MGKPPRREAGFSIVELLVLVVIVAILGIAGWFVYKQRPNTSAFSVTPSAPSHATSTTKTNTTTHSHPITNYFTIKEWGVRAPYNGTDTLSYSFSSDSPNVVWLSSQQLAHADPKNCGSGDAGAIYKNLPTDNFSRDGFPAQTVQEFLNQDFAASNSQPPAYSKVDGYYYIYGHGDVGCNTSNATIAISNQAKRTFESLVAHFQAMSK